MSKIVNIEKAKKNAKILEYHEIDGLTEQDALDVLLFVGQDADYAFDKESGHSVADNVLLSLVKNQDIRDAYEEVEKWYS